MNRTARIATVLVLALAFTAMGFDLAHASPSPASRVTAPRVWHTCQPQATSDWGIYQRDNDEFAGMRGRSCITAKGSSLTIDSNYRPQAGVVVAYPAIRVGDYPYNRDPKSGLPEQVSKVRRLWVTVHDTGTAGGTWIDDLDLWFGRTPATATHHIREFIIVNRWNGYDPRRGDHLVKVGRRRWYIDRAWTSNGSYSWPLIRFVTRTHTRRVFVDMQAFLKIARRHRWITGRMVLSSISAGTECWSGCRGLTDSMQVTR